jgi:hypothetical protein
MRERGAEEATLQIGLLDAKDPIGIAGLTC